MKALRIGIGLLTLLMAANCRTAAEPLDSLLCHWPLDEGKGSIAHDTSSPGNHLEIVGTRWVKGRAGHALKFDGKDDIIRAAKPITLPDGITISSWVNADVVGGAIVGTGWHDSPRHWLLVTRKYIGWHYSFYRNPSDPSAGIGGTERTLLHDLPTNQWFHLALTVDYRSGKLACYVNGKLLGERQCTGIVPLKNNAFTFGNLECGTFPFRGILDSLQLHSKALSSEEIQKLAME